jgi:hypothetical protein
MTEQTVSKPAEDEGPEDGHTFRFTYESRGSYTVTGDATYRDAQEFDGIIHTVDVRAWSLRDAFRKAAGLSFGVLMSQQVEKSEPIVEGPRVKDGVRLTPYDCGVQGHVLGQWMPRDQSTYYSSCVIPGCKFVQDKAARG